MSLQIMSLGAFSLLIAVQIPSGISPWSASSVFRAFFQSCTDFFLRYSSLVVSVVVACAVSEHRSRAPVESCGVVCCTPQAPSLFPESWHSVLCLPLCLCPFLLVYCPPVYIYCSGLGTFPPVSFPPLQVTSFTLLPLIQVSFPPLQSPWCSVTQGPFESCF